MRIIASHRNSFFAVALLLLCRFPSFAVSQNQSGGGQNQTNAINSNADDASSWISTNKNWTSIFDGMNIVNDDHDDDRFVTDSFAASNFSATTEPANFTISSDYEDIDEFSATNGTSIFEETLDDDNDTTTESIVDDTPSEAPIFTVLPTNSIQTEGVGTIANDEPETSNDNDNSADNGTGEDPEFIELPPADIPESSRPDGFPPTESLENDRKSGVDSAQAPNGSGNDRIESDGISLGAIIGISIGASVLVIAITLLVYYFCVLKKRRDDDGGAGESLKELSPKFSSPGKKTLWIRSSKRKSSPDEPDDLIAHQTLLGIEKSNNGKNNSTDDIESSTGDLESQAMYSYNQSYAESGSVYTNGSNIKIHSNHSYNYGNDNTSYAYSLEPGIEASVVDGGGTNGRGGGSKDGNSSSMPIREIPQVRSPTANKKDTITQDHFGNTYIETVPSELKLTKSELEMLPSNLRSSDDEDENDNTVGDSFQGGRSKKSATRKVLAPAGKLGIVIDTTIEGPVVHKVNPGSKLSGKVFPGDIIVAIDDVETRAMSASAITAVMVKTAKQNRTLTLLGAP